jgi:peptidoglycan-associated lipoprotein
MNLSRTQFYLSLFALSLVLVGCCRSSYDVWEDTKTCGRHMGRGLRSLSGRSGDSRAVRCPEEFYRMDEPGEDFIPLQDDSPDRTLGVSEMSAPQPRETPGDFGSTIPGIEAFQDPTTNSMLAHIFRNVHFEYNQNLVKGQQNLEILHNIAFYMRQNPNTYLFVEGHCDERGPEAYNQALGTRRANAVRNFLVNEGINPNHIFTVSYGKERPLVFDHHEEAWSQNRRAEFKIYQR